MTQECPLTIMILLHHQLQTFLHCDSPGVVYRTHALNQKILEFSIFTNPAVTIL